MNNRRNYYERLYFSYGQFMIYDQCVEVPGCDWTQDHVDQGFARRDSTICVGALFEFGYADATVWFCAYEQSEEDERVIEVPFTVQSGKVVVEGPEESRERCFAIDAGYYKVT